MLVISRIGCICCRLSSVGMNLYILPSLRALSTVHAPGDSRLVTVLTVFRRDLCVCHVRTDVQHISNQCFAHTLTYMHKHTRKCFIIASDACTFHCTSHGGNYDSFHYLQSSHGYPTHDLLVYGKSAQNSEGARPLNSTASVRTRAMTTPVKNSNSMMKGIEPTDNK